MDDDHITTRQQQTGSFDYESLPTVTALRLREVAIDVREAHAAAVDAISKIGNCLIIAKSLLSHGTFIAWVGTELSLTAKTAQRYMNTSRFLEGKATCMSLLPAHLIYRIAAPSADPEIVQDVVEAAEAGAPLTVKEIEKRLDAAASGGQARQDMIRAATVSTRAHISLPIDRVLLAPTKEQDVADAAAFQLGRLAGRVTGMLGDDLLRQMLSVLDNKQDQSIFIDLLRRGLAQGGAP